MIEVVASTGSTSADLAARLVAGERVPEGAWLVADRQTAGKGRRGRTWFDRAGNYMGSTIVGLLAGDPAPETLALSVALAVHAVADRHAPGRARLKWPNDVVVGESKLAGILLERVGEAVVIGIGINLVAAPVLDDRPAVSLADIAAPVARDVIAADLADAFAQELRAWRGAGLAPVIRRWLAAAHPLGTPLALDLPGEAVTGTFAGLAEDGALLLRLAGGEVRTVRAGEVRLVAPDAAAEG